MQRVVHFSPCQNSLWPKLVSSITAQLNRHHKTQSGKMVLKEAISYSTLHVHVYLFGYITQLPYTCMEVVQWGIETCKIYKINIDKRVLNHTVMCNYVLWMEKVCVKVVRMQQIGINNLSNLTEVSTVTIGEHFFSRETAGLLTVLNNNISFILMNDNHNEYLCLGRPKSIFIDVSHSSVKTVSPWKVSTCFANYAQWSWCFSLYVELHILFHLHAVASSLSMAVKYNFKMWPRGVFLLLFFMNN